MRSAASTALYLSLASGFLKLNAAIARPKNWGLNNYPEEWFKAKSMEAFYALLRSYSDSFKMPTAHSALVLQAPQLADNGAMVNVSIRSRIPNTEALAIVVAENPSVLACCVVLGLGMQASLQTRLKMQQSGDVYALAFADNNLYFAKQTVTITLGGCGM